LELELGHLHFLRWPDDGVNRILDAIHLNQGTTLLPAEDETFRLMKELMESRIPSLVSLAKDFIAFRRLIPNDPEMAMLRAVRIATRALTYAAQGLGLESSGDDGRFVLEEVLRKVHAAGLLGSHDESGVQALIRLSQNISLDDILNPTNGEGSSTTTENSGEFVSPLTGLLRAVLSVSKNPAQSAAITSNLQVIKGSAASKEMLQQAFLVGQRTFGVGVMPNFSGMEKMHHSNPDSYRLLVQYWLLICLEWQPRSTMSIQ
jgi:hypothetical protein